jgi:hypothetical protein
MVSAAVWAMVLHRGIDTRMRRDDFDGSTHQGILASKENNPSRGGPIPKSRGASSQVCGILYGLRAHPRNKNRLAGLEVGATRALAGTISDFATLVRKSYSDALSPVSTLVLAKARYERLANLGTPNLPDLFVRGSQD